MSHATRAQFAPLSRSIRASLLAAFAFVICFTVAGSIKAATYTVINTANSGAGSLRQAVLDANGTAANDIVNFNIPIPGTGCVTATGVCTITLTTGEIAVQSAGGTLTINGTGANRLTISGNNSSRIFYSNAATFTLRGVTLTGGNGAGAANNGNGGAIYASGGVTTISGVYFAGNSGTSQGGGIDFIGGSGTHRIENSTFSGNIAGDNGGGGIYVNGANLTVVNTTLTGNTALSGYGGGICAANAGVLTLLGDTITANTGLFGGGIYRDTGTLSFGNTIIAGNTATVSFPEIHFASGSAASQGFNLVGATAPNSTTTSAPITYQLTDIQNTPPQLDTLANYGGTVPTMRLQATSPALDKGSLAGGGPSDGRGVIRPYDNRAITNASGGNGADIGAFELIATSAFGWGFNFFGAVGDNSTTDRSLPTAIAGGFTDIVAVEGGSNHVLALRSNGTLLAWGRNSTGQLGDNSLTQRNSPVVVSGGLINVIATAGGSLHSLALLADGSIRAWGFNSNGQLGNNSTTSSSIPVTVSGISTAVAIAVGGNSSYALLADGSVKAWGLNTNGQLGDNSTTQRTTPVQVSGLTASVISIDGGSTSAYALLADGSVRAWGLNTSGQLGDGTTTQRLTPVTPLNLTSSVVQIAGGSIHGVALKADGTVLTWGDDSSGQLGDGTAGGINSTPAVVSSNVVAIKCSSGNTTYARRRDGLLVAWGNNAEGEIGNGTLVSPQATPFVVPVDTGIGFFGGYGNGGYAGSPLAPVGTGAQFVGMGDATVSFGNVATAGTMQIHTFDPATTGLALPVGSYTILANSTGYDITTTAAFTGLAQVCIKVPNVIDQTEFNLLTILHDDNFDGVLDVKSIAHDYRKREICRTTSSFSPFVIAKGLAPSAANVSLSGRVTTGDGRGIVNAVMVLTSAGGVSRTAVTSSFGYYRFDDVTAGETYIISVSSKRFVFAPQLVTVGDELTNVDFVAK